MRDQKNMLGFGDEVLRYMICNSVGAGRNIIYPVYRNRLMGFLWRKTHWKCFITGWECNGKTFDKNTPESEMVDPPKPPVFKPYKDLPEVTRDA